MTASPTLPIVEGPAGLRLAVPPGFEVLDVAPDLLVLAAAEPADPTRFRANLTVAVAPVTPSTADVRGLGAVAVEGARSEHVGAHVLAYDQWDLPTGPAGAEGRHLRTSYPYPAGAVAVEQWLAVHDGLAITLTAGYDVTELETVTPYLEAALEGLRLPSGGTAVEPEAVALDPFLTTLGESLEDLDLFGPPEVYRPLGPQLEHATLVALAKAHVAGRDLSGLPRGTVPELAAAELADDQGGWTPPGRRVAKLLSSPTARVRIEASVDGVPLSIECYGGEGGALLVSTLSPVEVRQRRLLSGGEVERAASQVRLDLAEPGFVPLALAQWLGLGPAWSVATEPDELPLTAVTARGDDPDTPVPPGGDESLRDLWRRAWFPWTLVTSARGPGLVAVDAGPRGQFALTRASDAARVGLQPVPSAAVWQTLVAQVAAAFTG